MGRGAGPRRTPASVPARRRRRRSRAARRCPRPDREVQVHALRAERELADGVVPAAAGVFAAISARTVAASKSAPPVRSRDRNRVIWSKVDRGTGQRTCGYLGQQGGRGQRQRPTPGVTGPAASECWRRAAAISPCAFVPHELIHPFVPEARLVSSSRSGSPRCAQGGRVDDQHRLSIRTRLRTRLDQPSAIETSTAATNRNRRGTPRVTDRWWPSAGAVLTSRGARLRSRARTRRSRSP